MFNFINFSWYHILLLIIRFVNFADAKKYVKVPELLKKQVGVNEVEYHYDTTAQFEIKQEKIGNEVIYTCRVGDYGEGKFLECFPYPPPEAIPKFKTEEMAKTGCDEFSKLHKVYWVHEHVVWCDIQPRPKTEMVRFISNVHVNEFGTIIFYHRREKPTYELIYFTNAEGKHKFTCKIGVNVIKNGISEMVECFPYPSKYVIDKRATSSDKITTEKSCKTLTNKHFVYWFNDRVVWCDEVSAESQLTSYFKGAYILKMKSGQQQTYYGEEIYYDLTVPAVYEKHWIKDRNGLRYTTCKIGCFLNNVFHECFPEPKRYRTEKSEKECQNLAENYITYWEGTRLVWCGEKQTKTDVSLPITAKFIKVPTELYDRFAKIIFYNDRTKAVYRVIRQFVNDKDYGLMEKYVCKVGYIDTRNGNNNMIDCFPYPESKRLPRDLLENDVEERCKSFAAKYWVYLWFDGRVVWCNKDKEESNNLASYHRGAFIFNLMKEFWDQYGERIYYDRRSVARYEINYSLESEEKIKHICAIGDYDNKNVFNVCFPRPSAYMIPRGENLSETEEKCKALADSCTMYWEDERLVWCELNFDSKIYAKHKKLRLS